MDLSVKVENTQEPFISTTNNTIENKNQENFQNNSYENPLNNNIISSNNQQSSPLGENKENNNKNNRSILLIMNESKIFLKFLIQELNNQMKMFLLFLQDALF